MRQHIAAIAGVLVMVALNEYNHYKLMNSYKKTWLNISETIKTLKPAE